MNNHCLANTRFGLAFVFGDIAVEVTLAEYERACQGYNLREINAAWANYSAASQAFEETRKLLNA